jgi:hypothetical protein
MKKTVIGFATLFAATIALSGIFGLRSNAQSRGRGTEATQPEQPLPAPFPLDEAYLEWPLPHSDLVYGSIDGKHLHQYVSELAKISDQYRDQGHQLWGRITGTSGDEAGQQWLISKFKQIGLTDVHAQDLPLPPQWLPKSWEVTANGGGKTLHLASAQPVGSTPGTPQGGLDLEAVYVGLGSPADFAGKDVRGKAVFVFSVALPGMWYNTGTTEGGLKLAEEKGAAAIFDVILSPGNTTIELYPTGNTVPTFSMGMEDGYAMRDLIALAPAGRAPHVKVALDVQMVPNLKTATIWGTLPGMTDEKIYVVAHRDAWFEGATDDASGQATQLGIAEYFAKIPKQKRRRTIVFLGTTGHHSNSGTPSGKWIVDHHDEVFSKTALLINCEHTATTQTYMMRGVIRVSNSTNEANLWYLNGSARLNDIAVKAFREFGEPTYAQPERIPMGEIGSFYKFAPSLQVLDVGMFAHSDKETPDMVPWTGLEAITRAFAKIIDKVNTLDLKDLQPQATAYPSASSR